MKQVHLKIKALSVNQCWQGRRFKTPAYKDYEHTVTTLLPKLMLPEGKMQLKLKVGTSSKNSDTDNPTKPFLDILSKAYGFNDKVVYKIEIEKKDVEKGEEFVEFTLLPYPNNGGVGIN